MAAIGLAESRGRNVRQQGQPYAKTGWGIWQITPGNSEPQFGVDQALLDPHVNAEAARAKEESQGLDAWTTYTSGAYKEFMPKGGRRRRGGGGGGNPADWGVLAPSHFAGVDQGVDFSGSGRIPALGNGRVTDVSSASIIEGGSYPVVVYELDSAPPSSSGYVYVAENFRPAVKRGQRVKLGQTIGEAPGKYPYIEVGWNRGPKGWSPVAPLNPNPHGAKQAGRDMWNFIRSVEGGSPIAGVPGTGTSVVGTRSRPGTGGGGGGWAGDVWGGLEDAAGAVADNVGVGGVSVGSLFGGASDLITGPLDFLKAALWLVNPLNWLRAFEAIVGVGLIAGAIAIFVGADKYAEQAAETIASAKIPE